MSKRRKHNKGLPERVYFKHGAYYFVNHSKKWIRLGKTKAEMFEGLAELEIKPEGGYKVKHLWTDFIEDRSLKLSPATSGGYASAVTKIIQTFGHMQLDEIESKDIAKYLIIRGKKSEFSANREIALLSSMFTYAVSLGLAKMNPCLRVKRFKLSARSRYIEDWELEEFKKICCELMLAYVNLKYLTGLRKTDMLLLKLTDIRETGLYVKPHKTQNSTGERREFTLTDDLKMAIDDAISLKRPAHQQLLFCNKRGQPFINENLETQAFDYLFRNLMNKAIKETKLSNRFQERDIRAKTATDADDDDQDATKILGHENSSTTRLYIRSKKVNKVMPLQKK